MSDLAPYVEKAKAGLSIVADMPAMIAFVEGLTDAKQLKEANAQATAVVAYLATKKDESVADYNAAFEVKMKAEHRLGEVLKKTVKHKGRPKKSDTVSDFNGRVPDGIAPRQSSRAQKLAETPWVDIKQRIDAATKSNKKASKRSVTKKEKPREPMKDCETPEDQQNTHPQPEPSVGNGAGSLQRPKAMKAAADVIDFLMRSPLVAIGLRNPHRGEAFDKVIRWLQRRKKGKDNGDGDQAAGGSRDD